MRDLVAFMMVTLIGVAACADGSTEPVPMAVGTWELVAVNGSRVPYTFQDADHTIVSGTLYLLDGGSAASLSHSAEGYAYGVGWWSQQGGVIELGVWPIGSGRVSAEWLEVKAGPSGTTFRFRRSAAEGDLR